LKEQSIVTEVRPASKSMRQLALLLRGIGCLDLLALVAVVMPQHWMDVGHKWLGLGSMPHEPIVGYLARSASALYALHGAMILFISFDVERYERLIRFLALAALVHGAVIFGIDFFERLPALWRYGEGPAFAATGVAVLWLQRKRRRES
jgi:hypothetical protein